MKRIFSLTTILSLVLVLSCGSSPNVNSVTSGNPTINNDYAEAAEHNKRGRELDSRGQYSEAEKEYRAAVKLVSDNIDYLNDLGIFLYNQGKSSEAKEVFMAARRINREDWTARDYIEKIDDDQRQASQDREVEAGRIAREAQKKKAAK